MRSSADAVTSRALAAPLLTAAAIASAEPSRSARVTNGTPAPALRRLRVRRGAGAPPAGQPLAGARSFRARDSGVRVRPSSGAIASTSVSGSKGARRHEVACLNDSSGAVQPTTALDISVPPYSVRLWCGRRPRRRSDRRPCPRRSRRPDRTIQGFHRDPRKPAARPRRDCAAP